MTLLLSDSQLSDSTEGNFYTATPGNVHPN